MAVNKIVFNNKVLMDLTKDTVTEKALLKGYTAHKADGTVVTGTAFAGYPSKYEFFDGIEDSTGTVIRDNSNNGINGRIVYSKL